MSDLLYKQETYRIIGAAFEVHKHLGPGFLEAVYQEALECEFRLQEIPFISQPKLHTYYKGQMLSKYYVPDFICFDKIIVEIKAIKACAENEQSQIINSIKVAGKKLGILINFGEKSLYWKRFANSRNLRNSRF